MVAALTLAYETTSVSQSRNQQRTTTYEHGTRSVLILLMGSFMT